MTDANTIREATRSTYKARVRGDLEGTVALFADDAVFDFNGEGVGLPNMGTAVRGKPAIRLLMTEFIDAFRMSDWEEVSLVVEGDKAALH
jgi:ketosteroid isomerase-like protein